MLLRAGGANASLVLRQLLLPPLVWRAGKTAAAVRFAAVTALATMLRHQLAPADVLLELMSTSASRPPQEQQPQDQQPQEQQQQQPQQQQGASAPPPGAGQLLPLVLQCLDEDWYADVRLTACAVMAQLMEALGGRLSAEQLRSVYPELLKRLDDSSNGVRVAACGALRAFVGAAGAGYCATNAGYLAAGVVIHMDDSDPGVAEAACGVLEALAGTHPGVVGAEVGRARETFRGKHWCDRVLARCGGAGKAQQQ
jgi:dynein assembly factor 5